MQLVKPAKKFFTLLLSLLFLSSCGYHCGQLQSIDGNPTITLPYVEGDKDGSLTSAIVRQLSQSSSIAYCSEGGSLLLNVKIVAAADHNIGYRYDRNKEGRRIDTIIPSETRLSQVVEVSLTEASSGRQLLPVVQLNATVECDHDYNTIRQGINTFSLGQLTVASEAFEAAKYSLHQATAKKTIDYILFGW